MEINVGLIQNYHIDLWNVRYKWAKIQFFVGFIKLRNAIMNWVCVSCFWKISIQSAFIYLFFLSKDHHSGAQVRCVKSSNSESLTHPRAEQLICCLINIWTSDHFGSANFHLRPSQSGTRFWPRYVRWSPMVCIGFIIPGNLRVYYKHGSCISFICITRTTVTETQVKMSWRQPGAVHSEGVHYVFLVLDGILNNQKYIKFWTFLLHKLSSASCFALENGCILTQDALSEELKCCLLMHLSSTFFFLFCLFSFTLCCFHPLLTCGCLCLRVLHPGFKRNTVWTQQMPSKFLAASWLHGMEYFNSHFLWALETCIAIIIIYTQAFLKVVA